jgi:hypothetical protein
MPARCATDLSQTANTITLDAWDGLDASLKLRPLLSVSADRACWRIIEIASRSRAPFEVSMSWGAGGGSVATAKVTVSRCTRIGVYARSLHIEVANLYNAKNDIVVAVADSDSFVQTRNQYEYRGTIVDDTGAVLDIPPFATHVRLDCDNKDSLADLRLRLVDGQGVTRLHLTGDQIPQDGVPMGSAHSMQVTHITDGTVQWRTVFLLSL